MLNVWSRTTDDLRKCRSCIAGNFQRLDPAAQRWTAQAEPSSIFVAAKMAAMRRWEVSKLDVKGAFLNAPIPPDELILVEPPKQWKDWGIVGRNAVWKLRRGPSSPVQSQYPIFRQGDVDPEHKYTLQQPFPSTGRPPL